MGAIHASSTTLAAKIMTHGVVRPGGGLVVGGAGFKAAVQDADETVGELTQGGVVPGSAGALLPARGRPSAIRLWPWRASGGWAG